MASAIEAFLNMTVVPEDLRVIEDTVENLVFDISTDTFIEEILVNAQVADAKICQLETKSSFRMERTKTGFQHNLGIRGVFVGRTSISFDLAAMYANMTEESFHYIHPIAVLRDPSSATIKGFQIFITLMVVTGTFMMGTQLDLDAVKKVFRKPIAPMIGVFCQFVLMPCIAFGWGQLLLAGRQDLQLGYFAVGCSPGGGASNYWTILLDGNLDLSIAMTFCSNIFALFFMPAWLLTLGQKVIARGSHVVIPFRKLLLTLLSLIVPTVSGILAKIWKPEISNFFKNIMRYITLVFSLLLFTFGIYANLYIFQLFTWKIVLCGFLLPYTGFAVAAGIAWTFRQEIQDIKTIAIETGIQNGTIAILLLTFSLGQPEADIAMVMAVASVIFTPLPLTILLFWSIVRKTQRRKANQKVASRAAILKIVDQRTAAQLELESKPENGESVMTASTMSSDASSSGSAPSSVPSVIINGGAMNKAFQPN